jgi:hypothetical protein
VQLYRRFFPAASMVEAQLFVDSHPEVKTMAEFQGLLLALESRSHNPEQVSFEFEAEISVPVTAA